MNCPTQLGPIAAYIFYYDLSKPRHEALIQKFPLGRLYHLYSMKMTYFGDRGYLYIMTNDEVITIQCNEYYTVSIPENQMRYFENHNNLTFTVKPVGRQFGVYQDIKIHFVKTGFKLEALENKVNVTINGEEQFITMNLDEYFTGYRTEVNILYPKSYTRSNFSVSVSDSNLISHSPGISLLGKYEFSSVQEDDKKQKGLIYLGNSTYLYID